MKKYIYINFKAVDDKTTVNQTRIHVNSVICVTYVQKEFRIRTLIKQFLTKYQTFTKLPQISTKMVIFKV